MDKDKVKFNFDEFYKAHYGEALKRQRKNKQKEKEAKIRATYYTMRPLTQKMLMMGVSLLTLAVGLFVLPAPPVHNINRSLKR
jgi:type II secretory pathway component PulM